MTKKILCIIGTRPEVIKMAPVIWVLQKAPWADVKILVTAQHRDLLDQMMKLFELTPHIDLDIMKPDQQLPELTAKLIQALDRIYSQEKPDLILAQGDTTTVFTAALASFYHRIPFGHIEAGLRTHDLYNPFPEEANRLLAAQLATYHFAPTETAKQALLKENIAETKIFVTGNTVIDSLLYMAEKADSVDVPFSYDKTKKLILVTVHRRENFGKAFLDICAALRALANLHTDIQIVYPVHPNPNIHAIAHRELGDHARIILSPPLDYLPFIQLMKECYCILTDSGGIQEEAPALGKPVLVLRAETERPEAMQAGVAKLIGTDINNIIQETQLLLTNKDHYNSMAKHISPYGDGNAAKRIGDILYQFMRDA